MFGGSEGGHLLWGLETEKNPGHVQGLPTLTPSGERGSGMEPSYLAFSLA